MKIAYLILAHKDPGQLMRLASRLAADNTWIFIHLDNKTVNVNDYFKISNNVRNTCFIAYRTNIKWGAYSMVQATLNSLQQIMDSGLDFDYINLISGQDYPIKTNAAIQDFLERNRGHEFISYEPFPAKSLPDGGMDRIESYCDYDDPGGSLENLLKGVKRKFLKGMKPYTGSQWWSLTGDCVRYILDQVSKNRTIVDFYKYTKFSDEHFFQTMVMNSPFAERAVNDSLRYVDWSGACFSTDGTGNTPHPKILTTLDIPRLFDTQALFARKFDESIDSRVMFLIDNLLLYEEDPFSC